MITAITYQKIHNKKYLNELCQPLLLGERKIEDLVLYFSYEAQTLQKLSLFVSAINLNKENCDIKELAIHYFGTDIIDVTRKSKTSRTYHISGLTIHEQD